MIRTLDGPKTAGINRVMWNLAPSSAAGQGGGQGFGGGGGGRGGFAQPVDPGTYLVTLTVNGKAVSKTVNVLQDIWLRE